MRLFPFKLLKYSDVLPKYKLCRRWSHFYYSSMFPFIETLHVPLFHHRGVEIEPTAPIGRRPPRRRRGAPMAASQAAASQWGHVERRRITEELNLQLVQLETSRSDQTFHCSGVFRENRTANMADPQQQHKHIINNSSTNMLPLFSAQLSHLRFWRKIFQPFPQTFNLCFAKFNEAS